MANTGWAPVWARVTAIATLIAGVGLGLATPGVAARHFEVVGHRGGSQWGPESTLVTFGHAIRAGADGIEFDVRFTSDHIPIAMHDPTLDRTTTCHGPVAAITFRDLEQCDAGVRFGRSFRGVRVPTLAQSLTFIKDHSPTTKLYLHVKRNDPAEAGEIMREVKALGWDTDRLTVIGADEAILATMRAAGAHRLGYIFENAAGWNTNYQVLIPYDIKVSRSLVAGAQRRGIRVLTVEDHPATLDQCADLGADGLLANNLDDAIDVTSGRAEHRAHNRPAHHDAGDEDGAGSDGGLFP